MAGWKNKFQKEEIRSPETVIHEFKPFSRLADVVEEFQQVLANEFSGEGDQYIDIDVLFENNKLTIRGRLKEPPSSLPEGGDPGMVLTRGSADIDEDGGAYWDYVRAIDL